MKIKWEEMRETYFHVLSSLVWDRFLADLTFSQVRFLYSPVIRGSTPTARYSNCRVCRTRTEAAKLKGWCRFGSEYWDRDDGKVLNEPEPWAETSSVRITCGDVSLSSTSSTQHRPSTVQGGPDCSSVSSEQRNSVEQCTKTSPIHHVQSHPWL